MNESQLLKTTDAGQTWVVVQPLFYAKDINFKNSLGFIVGLSGYVLKSIDYGQTWVQINTTYNYSYNSVSIIDANNIIISSNNEIVTTTDGGITWTSTSVIGYPSIVKTVFTSTLNGHAACMLGSIIKTVNGGISWYVTETVSTTSNFLALYFINDNIGFATREYNKMFKTTNAGETWIQIPSIIETMNCIYFTDQSNGFAAGDDGFIYKTIDGGNTWTFTSYVGGNGVSTYFGVHFLNNNIGFVCGERGRIAKTTNGGITWTEYSPTYNDIIKNQFKSVSIGYSLIQINGDFLKTVDGGNSWQIVGSLNQFGRDFDFVNENVGYATSSDNGFVYKTINGGVTWVKTNNNFNVLNDGSYSNVYFYNENIGFASGGFNSPRTSKTINGGATWQQIANYTLSQLKFFTPAIGFGLYGGNINKTTNGGTTWAIFQSGTTAFDALNENTIYAVGNNVFRKSTDGGNSWQETILTNTGIYTHIRFYNNQIGYMMRNDSTIFSTINGGQNWAYLTNFTGINHFDLFNSNLSVSGNGGVIFKSTRGTLDIEEYNEENNLIIYPNPASDFINIDFKQNIEVSSINLYNFIGKKVKYLGDVESSNEIYIDCSNLSKGVYFININFKNGKVENRKIIIK